MGFRPLSVLFFCCLFAVIQKRLYIADRKSWLESSKTSRNTVENGLFHAFTSNSIKPYAFILETMTITKNQFIHVKIGKRLPSRHATQPNCMSLLSPPSNTHAATLDASRKDPSLSAIPHLFQYLVWRLSLRPPYKIVEDAGFYNHCCVAPVAHNSTPV